MPGHIKMPVAASEDIADKAVNLLTDRTFAGHTSVEIISDRISFDEIARVLGETLDIPSLRYIEFSDSDTIVAFMGMGFSRSVASSYVVQREIPRSCIRPRDPIIIEKLESDDSMLPPEFEMSIYPVVAGKTKRIRIRYLRPIYTSLYPDIISML